MPHVSQLEDDLQVLDDDIRNADGGRMNAIERLRADHIDSGIALGHIDTDECKSSCVVCASLAAVEALYQAAKLVDDLSEEPVEDFDALWSACEELHRCLRRVEGKA